MNVNKCQQLNAVKKLKQRIDYQTKGTSDFLSDSSGTGIDKCSYIIGMHSVHGDNVPEQSINVSHWLERVKNFNCRYGD